MQKLKKIGGTRMLVLFAVMVPILYLTYSTLMHTIHTLQEVRGAEQVSGEIVVLQHDVSEVPSEQLVTDEHTVPPYGAPGFRYKDQNGTMHTATIRSGEAKFRIVGKQIQTLVHPHDPLVAYPVKFLERWPMVINNSLTLLFLIVAWLLVWFRIYFPAFSLLPFAFALMILKSGVDEFVDQRALAKRAIEADFTTVANTRESATCSGKGLHCFGSIAYRQFQYPEGVFYTVKYASQNVKPDDGDGKIYFDPENPLLFTYHKPTSYVFWNRSMIVGVCMLVFALLIALFHIPFYKIYKKQYEKDLRFD